MPAAIIYDGLFNDDEDIVHIPFEEDIFLETHVFWQAGRYVSSSLKSFMSYISKVDFGSDTGLTVIQRENVPPRINIHFVDVLMQRRDMSEAPPRKISAQQNVVFSAIICPFICK